MTGETPAFPLTPSRRRAPDCVIATLRDEVDDSLDTTMAKEELLGERSLAKKIQQFEELLQSTIDARKRRLIESDLRNLRWSLRNRRDLVRMELILEHPILVHSLARTKGGWVGRVWVSSDSLARVELEDSFVRSLLTYDGYQRISGCFRGKKHQRTFVIIKKYERLVTLRETHFSRIQRLGNGLLRVTDIDSNQTTVSEGCAREHSIVPNDVLDCLDGDREVNIPMGSSANADSYTQEAATSSNDLAPRVAYKNGPNEHRCLVMGLASGLDFLGLRDEARYIATAYESGLIKNDGDQWNDFRCLVLDCFKHRTQKVYYRRPVTKDRKIYSPLNPDHTRRNPVVVGLLSRGRDGSRVNLNHCVCIVGKYVFDANQDVATVLCKQSLDKICSLVVSGATYCGLSWARELTVDKLLSIS